jgi:hypothetical protein
VHSTSSRRAPLWTLSCISYLYRSGEMQRNLRDQMHYRQTTMLAAGLDRPAADLGNLKTDDLRCSAHFCDVSHSTQGEHLLARATEPEGPAE